MKSPPDDVDAASLCKGNGSSPGQTAPLHDTGNSKHLHCKSPRVESLTLPPPPPPPFSSPPFFFLLCSRRLSAHENRTIKARGKKKKKKDNTTRRFSPVCVVVVLWQLQSLNLFSALAGRRGALYHRATPRRHLSSGVLSEHAYLFSDNSLFSLNRTKQIVSIFFLSIKTDELKVKKKHTKRTAASHECNRRACSHTVQTSAVLFLPSHSSHFCTEENESREERKLVLSGGGPQKKKK